MRKTGEESGGSDRATETKLKACFKKAKQAEMKSVETIRPFRLTFLGGGGQYTKKWGVLQGKEQPHFHSGCFAQSLASPDLNNETVWTSLRPVAETYVTKQKVLGFSTFLKENIKLPIHCNLLWPWSSFVQTL